MTEIVKPMTRQACEIMIQTMKDLKDKKIEAKDAQAVATLGIAIVQACNAEVQFIRATKSIPVGSAMGKTVDFLEPPCETHGKATRRIA